MHKQAAMQALVHCRQPGQNAAEDLNKKDLRVGGVQPHMTTLLGGIQAQVLLQHIAGRAGGQGEETFQNKRRV